MNDAAENQKVKSYSDTEGTFAEDATKLFRIEDSELRIQEEVDKEKIEMVEPKKPNRHERRRRAKLEKMLATKERLEKLKRKD